MDIIRGLIRRGDNNETIDIPTVGEWFRGKCSMRIENRQLRHILNPTLMVLSSYGTLLSDDSRNCADILADSRIPRRNTLSLRPAIYKQRASAMRPLLDRLHGAGTHPH